MIRTGNKIAAVILAVITGIAFIPLFGAQPAYAEGVLPYVTVGYVNADDDSYEHIQLNSETPYYINGAQEAAANSEDANAYYDTETGVLTLDNYQGASIDVGDSSGDLKIVLKGYNAITSNSQFGINVPGDLEITSAEKQTEEEAAEDTEDTNGILDIGLGYNKDSEDYKDYEGNTYGIYSGGNIVISRDADISITATSTGDTNVAGAIYTGDWENAGELTITGTASVYAECSSDSGPAYGFTAKKITIDTVYPVSYEGKGDKDGSVVLNRLEELDAAENCQIDLKTSGTDPLYNIAGDFPLLDQFATNDQMHVKSGCENDIAFFSWEQHDPEFYSIKATPTSDGERWCRCSVCGAYDEKVSDISKASGYKLAYTSTVYNGKAKKPAVTVTTEAGDVLGEDDYTVRYYACTNAGTARAKVTFKGEDYEGFKDLPFTIKKAANTLKASGRTAIVKYSKVKKKAQTLKRAKVIRLTKPGQGAKTYTKKAGNKKITIAKSNGKVTVKKGLKKGTYKVKVRIKAKGTSNYNARAQTVTFRIKVK